MRGVICVQQQLAQLMFFEIKVSLSGIEFKTVDHAAHNKIPLGGVWVERWPNIKCPLGRGLGHGHLYEKMVMPGFCL